MPRVHAALPSAAYRQCRQQLIELASLSGLEGSRALILRAFEAICRRSLSSFSAFGVGGYSRINADGTPLQFATTVGRERRVLQFLGEPHASGRAGPGRLAAARRSIASVAELFDARAELDEVTELLSWLAPENEPDLLIDPAGAFWIGAGFVVARSARLRVYVNGSWGREEDRWMRARRFASRFGVVEAWMELEKLVRSEMRPLGSAVTIARGEATEGRIYVSAHGKLMGYYEEVARIAGGDEFAQTVRAFAEQVMDGDVDYPTPTAVFSFGLGAGGRLDPKFELCGHCLFASDLQARKRLSACFDAAGLDASPYHEALEVVANGEPGNEAVELHAYVGVGIRRGERYFTVYLKPRLSDGPREAAASHSGSARLPLGGRGRPKR